MLEARGTLSMSSLDLLELELLESLYFLLDFEDIYSKSSS